MYRMLREEACREATGLSRSSRWRLEKLGQFPPRRQLAPNSVGWVESEVEGWLSSRAVGINPDMGPSNSIS